MKLVLCLSFVLFSFTSFADFKAELFNNCDQVALSVMTTLAQKQLDDGPNGPIIVEPSFSSKLSPYLGNGLGSVDGQTMGYTYFMYDLDDDGFEGTALYKFELVIQGNTCQRMSKDPEFIASWHCSTKATASVPCYRKK